MQYRKLIFVIHFLEPKGQEANAKNELGEKKTHPLGGDAVLARFPHCHVEAENHALKDNPHTGLEMN